MLSNNKWLVLVIVSTALFLISIDMTVLYIALPRPDPRSCRRQQSKTLRIVDTISASSWRVCFQLWVCAWRPDWASPSLSLGADCFCLCFSDCGLRPFFECPDRLARALSWCGRIHDDASDAFLFCG